MTTAVVAFAILAVAGCAGSAKPGAAPASAPARAPAAAAPRGAQAIQCFTADEMVRDTVLMSITGSASWFPDHVWVEAESGLLALDANDTLRAALAVPVGNDWRVLTLSGSYTGLQIGAGGQIVMPVRFHLAVPRGRVADSVALVFIVSRPLASRFDRRMIVPAQTCQPYLAPPSADHVAGSSVPSTHTE